jgi:hypothetical protein
LATFASISAVGVSLERYLNACFIDEPPLGPIATDGVPHVTALLVRTEDFDPNNSDSPIKRAKYALSIFFYRVDFNKVMRASWGAVGHLDGRSHLPLDLHFLLTAWAPNAEAELLILGRAMQCLETTPMLGGPMLHAYGASHPMNRYRSCSRSSPPRR